MNYYDPNINAVIPWNGWNTYPTVYPSQPIVSVISSLSEQDKEALRTMIREVVTEVIRDELDTREAAADEARRREYMEI